MGETPQAQPGPAVTGVPAVLPLAALASHPRNPRLAAAAASYEAAWTPELHDALAALASAGVTGPRSTAGDAVT